MNIFQQFALDRYSLLNFYCKNELRITSRLRYLLHVLSGGNSINRLKDRPDINTLQNLINKNEKKRLALFVAYHRPNSIPLSNLQYIKNLFECSFSVIYIHNGKLAKEVKQTLTKMGCYVICRKNVGQDFGGWKDALALIRKNKLDNILEWILLCNDSNFCLEGPNSESFVKKFSSTLSNDKKDFIGLNVNYDTFFHYQSYFLCFSKTIFKSRRFINFWRSYIPYSNRYYAISQGETKLSKQILRFYDCRTLYPTHELGPEIFKKDIKDHKKLIDLLPKNLFFLDMCFEKNSPIESGVRKMLNSLESYNQSHVFALYFVLFCQSPFLKKDLCRQGSFSTNQIYDLLNELRADLSEEFIKELMDHYVQQGTPFSADMMPRLRAAKGIDYKPWICFSHRYISNMYKDKYFKKNNNKIFLENLSQ